MTFLTRVHTRTSFGDPIADEPCVQTSYQTLTAPFSLFKNTEHVGTVSRGLIDWFYSKPVVTDERTKPQREETSRQADRQTGFRCVQLLYGHTCQIGMMSQSDHVILLYIVVTSYCQTSYLMLLSVSSRLSFRPSLAFWTIVLRSLSPLTPDLCSDDDWANGCLHCAFIGGLMEFIL